MKRQIRYGKAEIRCYRANGGKVPLFGTEITIDVFGDQFMASYTQGDNSNVVATDTMKNFTYAALLDYAGDTHEDWSHFLATRFLQAYTQMDWLRIRERELPFNSYSHQLYEGPRHDEHGVVELEVGRNGLRSLVAGVVDLRLVKLTGSAFTNFIHDQYTNLPERTDRPLYIYCDVHWRYGDSTFHVDPHDVAAVVREVFDGFVSMSIQHLLNEFGQVLLDRYPQIAEFSFEAQNRLWDTSAVSKSEPGRRVFSEPKPAHGVIGLTVSR